MGMDSLPVSRKVPQPYLDNGLLMAQDLERQMAASMTPQVDVNVHDAENRAPLSHPKYVIGSAWGRGR